MTNVNNPHGFKPVRAINSSNGQAKISYFTLASNNAVIGVGDPLELTAGDVDYAEASDALIGIAAEYKAANSGGRIAVWADPQQLFEAQTDDGTGTATTAATAIGKNVNFVAGTVTNNKSTAEIDESSAATTPTLPFKIIGLYADPKNAYGEFNRLVVKINNHVLGSHTGTVGS